LIFSIAESGFIAESVPILHREITRQFKEGRSTRPGFTSGGLKINVFLSDSLRQTSFSSAFSVFWDGPRRGYKKKKIKILASGVNFQCIKWVEICLLFDTALCFGLHFDVRLKWYLVDPEILSTY